MSVFHKNSVRICHIKLKIDTIYCLNDAFRNILFQISVALPLRNRKKKQQRLIYLGKFSLAISLENNTKPPEVFCF